MYIETIQPIHKCSKCNSTKSFTWTDVPSLAQGIQTINTWRQCSGCGHKSIESTTTTNNLEPVVYNMPKQEKYKNF